MSLIRFMLRWSWVMVIVMAIGAAAGFAFLTYGPLPYESSAVLEVRPQPDISGEPLVSTNPGRASTSAVALAGQAASPSVYDATSRSLAGQMEISSGELKWLVENGRITIQPVGSTSYIAITSSDPDPNRSWLLADGFARGFIEDIRAQTRVVTDRRRIEIQAEIAILEKQLAQVPLNFSNAGTVDTFSSVHAKLLDSLVRAQASLQLLSQAEQPVARYGDTSIPMIMTNPLRVVVAGAAGGGVVGLIVAYLLELLRQWRMSRAIARAQARREMLARLFPKDAQPPAAASKNGHGSGSDRDERRRRIWAGSPSL
jgi:hypothetical protein